MIIHRTKAIAFSVACVIALSGAKETTNVKTESDSEQIIGHIRSIFEAFLRQDRDAIRRLHTSDWTGFQGPSVKIERGIDAYMVNAESSLQNLHGVGYELIDTEVQIHGDIAIVYYVARYDYRDREGHEGSAPLRSVDIYRRENGVWNQAGSHITVIPEGGVWNAIAGHAAQDRETDDRP